MTDSQDPFAANPYTPPTDRDDRAATPTADDTAVQPPAAEAPVAPPAPAAPAQASWTEPTVEGPAQPAYAPAPPAPPAPVAAATPPADDYTHRYPAAGDPYAQSAPLDDPFSENEPTVSFAAAGGGQGGDGQGGVATAQPRRRGRRLIAALAFLILAGAAGYGGAWAFDQQDDSGSDSGLVSSLDGDNDAKQASLPAGTVEQVAAKVLPSVVQINVRGGQESGSGTGIIISSDGNILTNNHVVEVAGDGGTITVAFSDGSNTKAEIVGTDPKTDLAVIKAAGQTGLTAATLGTSADLRVGQEVVAIGSPFGLESTVTQGIISALNRPVSSGGSTGAEQTRTTFPAVQTDAAINPGNSGGPLVDLKGRVIAINSAIKSAATTAGDAGSIGLGFAIPIDLAKNVSKQLLDGKTVEHAQIGVSVDNFLGEDGITGMGAEVKDVNPDGAGEKAGLKEGDVITSVNGAIIPTSEALVAAVRGYNPGEKISLTYLRGGKKTEVDVTLGSDGGTTTE
nr:trypsin [Aeromicrobium sp.]